MTPAQRIEASRKGYALINAAFDREHAKPFRVIDVWVGPVNQPHDEFFSLLNMPGAE